MDSKAAISWLNYFLTQKQRIFYRCINQVYTHKRHLTSIAITMFRNLNSETVTVLIGPN